MYISNFNTKIKLRVLCANVLSFRHVTWVRCSIKISSEKFDRRRVPLHVDALVESQKPQENMAQNDGGGV